MKSENSHIFADVSLLPSFPSYGVIPRDYICQLPGAEQKGLLFFILLSSFDSDINLWPETSCLTLPNALFAHFVSFKDIGIPFSKNVQEWPWTYTLCHALKASLVGVQGQQDREELDSSQWHWSSVFFKPFCKWFPIPSVSCKEVSP